MKILFFTRRYSPEIGGVETHVREVTKRLVERGHTVVIITEMPSSTQQSLSDTDTDSGTNATIYRIPVGSSEKKKKFIIWKWLWKHKSLIEQADVIHAHDVFFWYLPFRFRYLHKPIYTTFHGYETVYPPEKRAIRMRRLSAWLSRGNISVGDYIRKWYKTYPSFVTYGGVRETKNEKSEVRKKGEKLRILFVGRMDYDTSVEQYTNLLKLLQRNRVEFTFLGLGDGPLKELFSKYGKTPGFADDVSSFVEKADIVFASSYLSILDALSQKKLVVSFYNNPLKKDYLTLSPFVDYIIADSAPDKAYQEIKFLIMNPNRLKKITSEGHAWAIKQTWEAVAKMYLTLWKM